MFLPAPTGLQDIAGDHPFRPGAPGCSHRADRSPPPRAGRGAAEPQPGSRQTRHPGLRAPAHHSRGNGSASGARESMLMDSPHAPGRIRACDPRIRSPPLCPLSYRRRAARYHPLDSASRRGGGSSVGRAPGCGPGGRGFESHPPPLWTLGLSSEKSRGSVFC